MGNFLFRECGIRCRSSAKEAKALEEYIKDRQEFIPRYMDEHQGIEPNIDDSLEAAHLKEKNLYWM